MTDLRLFIALDLSSEVKTLLAEQQSYLKHVLGDDWFRFVKSSSLHLTLVFIGLTPEHKLTGIKQAISFACRKLPPFSLTTGQLGAFPSRQRPSVIWTGVKGDLDALQTLQTRLSQQLSDLVMLEEYSYQPHLTLARVKQFGKNDSIYQALDTAPEFQAKSWTIENVNLLKSQHKTSGSEYQLLHSEPLTAYWA